MKPTVVVVGLGPAGPELITQSTKDLLDGDAPVFLRTRVHPAASIAPNASTFDHVYESADDMNSVYRTIVDELVFQATTHERVVYAVPGSPLVAEHTVELLRSDGRVATEIHAALSFLDLTWSRLEIDPLTVGPRVVDGHTFARDAAGERAPLLVAQCDSVQVLSDIKLAFEDVAPESVTVLQRLGSDDERILTVAWDDLDRVVDADHLTSLWIDKLDVPVGGDLLRVDEVARRLRRDCPWDRDQTHMSLQRYLIEESYELVDAIEALDAAGDEDLIEELGDVLFQVFAHTAIAAEQGRFNISDVANAVTTKLIGRHPHVYGDVVAETADDVLATWESNKKAEKQRSSLMDGIPAHLPALLYASKVLKKASSAGVTPEVADFGDGLGAALLGLVHDGRRQDVDVERELRLAADQLRARFERAEQLAAADGFELSKANAEQSQQYWVAARS